MASTAVDQTPAARQVGTGQGAQMAGVNRRSQYIPAGKTIPDADREGGGTGGRRTRRDLPLDVKSRRKLLGDDLPGLDFIDAQLVQLHSAVSFYRHVQIHRIGERVASDQRI
jgi:hypothetical protein